MSSMLIGHTLYFQLEIPSGFGVGRVSSGRDGEDLRVWLVIIHATGLFEFHRYAAKNFVLIFIDLDITRKVRSALRRP